MTVKTQVPAAAGGVGAVRRGRRFLWTLAGLVAVVAVCGWISLFVGLGMGVGRETKMILAVVAAVSTEALFWIAAAALGVSVLEARKRIWRRITGQS